MKRLLTIILAITVAITFVPFFGVDHAEAKKKKPKYYLVKSIKVQYKKNKKWKTDYKCTFKYNKHNDLVKYREIYNEIYKKKANGFDCKYRYVNGKKVSCIRTAVGEDNYKDVITYNKKGKPVKKVTTYGDGEDSETYKYTYDKKGSLKKATMYDSLDNQTETIKYNNMYRKGIHKKIVEKNYLKGKKKWKWLGSYYFTKKGYIEKITYPASYSNKYCYKHVFKKGRVSSIKGTRYYGDGYTTTFTNRYLFNYTKKTISKKRYRTMINDLKYSCFDIFYSPYQNNKNGYLFGCDRYDLFPWY